MKVTIKAYIHKDQHSDNYVGHSVDMSKFGYIFVGVHEFDYEIPADFNPITAQVAALRKGLDKLERDHDVQVANIKEQIQNLLCIENSVPA
jgi:hypothetical protein